MYICIWIDKNINQNNINDYISISNTNRYEYDSLEVLNNWVGNGKIVRLKYNYVSNGSCNFIYSNSSNAKFIPIYAGTGQFLSTDFALNFGFSNSLLDNLNIIANGNTQSNNSSSQADSTNQQANTVFTQEEQLVNNAENQLATDLQTLDIQNQNNNLFGNSKFIASASWVKTQFDTLTNNNAFGYLITFSLVIGLSLVIIGKLRG